MECGGLTPLCLASEVSVASKRVMIVDPNMYQRMVLSNILLSHGYSVCCEATNGRDALLNYEKARPDIVLVEARIPDKDGVAVVSELCSKFLGCQAVFCAGSGQRSQICAAMSAGAVDFLPKPYTEQGVVRTLRKLVAQQRPF